MWFAKNYFVIFIKIITFYLDLYEKMSLQIKYIRISIYYDKNEQNGNSFIFLNSL